MVDNKFEPGDRVEYQNIKATVVGFQTINDVVDDSKYRIIEDSGKPTDHVNFNELKLITLEGDEKMIPGEIQEYDGTTTTSAPRFVMLRLNHKTQGDTFLDKSKSLRVGQRFKFTRSKLDDKPRVAYEVVITNIEMQQGLDPHICKCTVARM